MKADVEVWTDESKAAADGKRTTADSSDTGPVCQPGIDPFAVVLAGLDIGEKKLFVMEDEQVHISCCARALLNNLSSSQVRVNTKALQNIQIVTTSDINFKFDAAYGTKIPHIFTDCVRPIVDAAVELGLNGACGACCACCACCACRPCFARC